MSFILSHLNVNGIYKFNNELFMKNQEDLEKLSKLIANEVFYNQKKSNSSDPLKKLNAVASTASYAGIKITALWLGMLVAYSAQLYLIDPTMFPKGIARVKDPKNAHKIDPNSFENPEVDLAYSSKIITTSIFNSIAIAVLGSYFVSRSYTKTEEKIHSDYNKDLNAIIGLSIAITCVLGLRHIDPEIIDRSIEQGSSVIFGDSRAEEKFKNPKSDMYYAGGIAHVNLYQWLVICALGTSIIKNAYTKLEREVEEVLQSIYKESQTRDGFIAAVKEELSVDISAPEFKKVGLGRVTKFTDYVSGKNTTNGVDGILNALFKEDKVIVNEGKKEKTM